MKCKRKFFGDAYLSIEELQNTIIIHMREEHGIELQPDLNITWGDILQMCRTIRKKEESNEWKGTTGEDLRTFRHEESDQAHRNASE